MVCPERDDRRVTIHPATKRQVISRLRAVVTEHNTYALNAKPDQGKVFDAISCHGASNRFSTSVISRLRAVVAEHNTYALNAKPDQGKVFDATSSHGASNRFSTSVSSTGTLCIARTPRRNPFNWASIG
ncbi:unnamed protein product [Heterotrigona itama]|uniref:Uncharacterized protein n=1 Tax=Heterotrigona itama TaxID=395501 RepID=A0A6V7GW77_9HYME|nr:unnamed protein product [Heterotrigona itama]